MLARAKLGLDGTLPAVALLPGSRSHEVRRLAPAMLDAMRVLERTRSVDVRLLLAPSLDEGTKRWVHERARGVRVLETAPEIGAIEWLGAFDAALAASGTATLECALAGAPPVIVYRVSALTAAIARRLVRTPHVGLPNILMRSARYPELLQEKMEPKAVAGALADLLDHRDDFAPVARDLRARLLPREPGRTSSERIAAFMGDWLGRLDVDDAPQEAQAELA
jgi:lipid-A-disaccharide synthase